MSHGAQSGLAHPVRQRTGSQRGRNTSTEADRAPLTLSRGVAVTGDEASKGSAWFPPRGPPVGSALPSTGSSEASSPASQVLWRCATPCTPRAGLGCLRLTIPCVAPVVSLPAVQVAQPRAWGSSSGPHCRNKTQGGKQGLPSSRETPSASVPCSSTPAGLHAPYHDGAPARPPRGERRRLPHWDFRSSIAWPQSWLSTELLPGFWST